MHVIDKRIGITKDKGVLIGNHREYAQGLADAEVDSTPGVLTGAQGMKDTLLKRGRCRPTGRGSVGAGMN